MPPRFITFEGLDGSGKSTHLATARELLLELGHEVVSTHEPGGTEMGDALRQVFLDPQYGEVDGRVEMLVVFASRRHHLDRVIEPALAAGKTVLCDRFTDSTIAYQGYGRGVSLEVIEAVDQLATGGRRPDLTLLFDLPPDEAQGRGQSARRRATPGGVDRLDAENLAFYSRVREGFLAVAAAEPERFLVIDSSGAKEETSRQLREAIASRFREAP